MKTVIAAALAALCLSAPAGAATYAWASLDGEFAFEFEINLATGQASFNEIIADFGPVDLIGSPSLRPDSLYFDGYAGSDVENYDNWYLIQRDQMTFEIFADGSARYVDFRDYEFHCYYTGSEPAENCPDNLDANDHRQIWSDEVLEGQWVDGAPFAVAVPLPAGISFLGAALYILGVLGFRRRKSEGRAA